MSSDNTKMTDEERSELIHLLHLASQIEHGLLNAYLFTACSIKSTPQEFKFLRKQDGSLVENRRRAIHFEKARQWKRYIIEICHEEMIHLHYVNCLIRALGERPYFELPAKDATDPNAWFIPNWVIEGVALKNVNGTKIPIKPFSLHMAKRFVAYESTDVLQDSEIFSVRNMAVYKEMQDFELNLHLELAFYRIPEGDNKEKARQEMKENYKNLTPYLEDSFISQARDNSAVKQETSTFQSIKALYDRVGALYQKADESGLIRPDLIDKDLNGELADNGEGLIPVGPIFRTTAYSKFNQYNNRDKMKMNFKDAERIIKEIVSEGEGMSSDLIGGFHDLQKNIDSNGGNKSYAGILLDQFANRRNPNYPVESWVKEGELIRQSHLYRFIQIFIDLTHELDLCDSFDPSREIIQETETVKDLCEQMLSYFNANFLAMLSWLSRIYELNLMHTDKPKRQTIEQLATWPLMSLVMRPFLELISFFPVDLSNLFNVRYKSDKYTLKDTKNLIILTDDPQQSQIKNNQIDQCIFNILEQTSKWCIDAVRIVEGLNIDSFIKQMIKTRLRSFKNLREFKEQFPYREGGGFGQPDASTLFPTDESKFPVNEEFDKMYSENPEEISIEAKDRQLFTKDQWLLKISFCGFSKMQFATDPEPPTDEAGCTGTTMFHPADGDKILTRSTLWDPNTFENIDREGCDVPLGVNVYKITLNKVITEKLKFDEINGEIESNLEVVAVCNQPNLYLNLEKNNEGHQPFYLGDNHLIWGDGEPVDPFILSINDTKSRQKIAQRDVFNKGGMRKMTPLQRSHSHRGPFLRDFGVYPNDQPTLNKRFCASTLRYMPASYGQFFKDPSRIDTNTYFNTRASSIFNLLTERVKNKTVADQHYVDQIESFTERLYFMPYGNAVGALSLQFPYWHTISGESYYATGDNEIFKYFATQGYNLNWSPDSERTQSNSRWYAAYAMSFGDFDALNNCCYGNLYIPVQVSTGSQN